jgi:type III restriction enzyme
MKIKFDSTQAYQQDAVSAFVDLFKGRELNQSDFTVSINETAHNSILETELGAIANNIMLHSDDIYKNLRLIQNKNNLDIISRNEFDKNGMNFSVEMETGTGKTYVYLRTIFELSAKYGFKKFVIVVPSVAIREGTLKNLEITNEHFKNLYNNIESEYFVYDSKKASRLRQFASKNILQIMVINIDAFRKDFSDSEDNKKSNVIFKEIDKMLGRKPIEYIQATNPFVIIDEPQSVDNTPKSQEAIKALNPACIFRFSATHKNLYNLVYKLDPVKAFELRLVKQIIVAQATAENSQNNAYMKLLEVDNKKGIKAKIRIQVQGKNAVSEKDIWVKQGDDLFKKSNERAVYAQGFEVLEISAEPDNSYIDFNSGRLMLGEEKGGIKEDIANLQIKKTIQKHLEKELALKTKGIKVLSLFFIDKVANYRFYDEQGNAQKGRFATLFEQYYLELIKLPRYAELASYPVEQLHDGYFSQDKKGVLKDTNGNTQADDDTYSKIMRNKEQLLSLDEPLKFIFSHSALREGWDNPNVFQICTLNETQSAVKKRQEIGRGLRLPVNQQGERIFNDTVNCLMIIANESYDEFAKKLQKEYEEDCGVIFGKVPIMAFNDLIENHEQSKQLWQELVNLNILDEKGKLTDKFTPDAQNFSLNLSDDFSGFESDIIAILKGYELKQHIRKEQEPKKLKLNKQVYLSPEFKELWDQIKYKTSYRVNYDTNKLIESCIKAIKEMDKIESVRILYREDSLQVAHNGINTKTIRSGLVDIEYAGGLPDMLAYLQKQTELTRKTLVTIIKGSGRITEFMVNPQRFMDEVSKKINHELHQLMIDGIEYDKVTEGDIEWNMTK